MSSHTTFAVRENAGPALSPTPQPVPELAVLVPTRNEAANIEELLRRVSAAVARRSNGACRVSLFHRRGGQRTGGLGGAVVDGLRAAAAPWACVLDADLQHPPEIIPRLLAAVEQDGADLAVASRYCGAGRADGLGPARALISTACGSAAKLLFPMRVGGVTDPMSGFFLVRRSAVQLEALRPRGFKILLELLVRHGGLRATEVPYTFADRHAGESKGTLREGLTYLGSLAELRLGRGTPPPSPTTTGPTEAERLVPLARQTRTVGA